MSNNSNSIRLFLALILTITPLLSPSISAFALTPTQIAAQIAQQPDPTPPSEPGFGSANTNTTTDPKLVSTPNTVNPNPTIPNSSAPVTLSSANQPASSKTISPTSPLITSPLTTLASVNSAPISNTNSSITPTNPNQTTSQTSSQTINPASNNTVRTGGFGAMEKSIAVVSAISLVILIAFTLNKKRNFNGLSK